MKRLGQHRDNIARGFLLQTSSEPHQRVKRRRKLGVRFDGVDMRSRQAHRLKAIFADLVARFGDDAYSDTLREIAVHRVALEAMQAEIVAGRPAASERAVRHSNVIARLERELHAVRRKSMPSAPGLTLAEVLAQHRSSVRGEPVDGHRDDAGTEEAVA